MISRIPLVSCIAALGALSSVTTARAQNRSTSYQGELKDNGAITPGHTHYSMTLRLYDAATLGNLLEAKKRTATVANSLFTTALDFAVSHFNGGGWHDSPRRGVPPCDTVSRESANGEADSRDRWRGGGRAALRAAAAGHAGEVVAAAAVAGPPAAVEEPQQERGEQTCDEECPKRDTKRDRTGGAAVLVEDWRPEVCRSEPKVPARNALRRVSFEVGTAPRVLRFAHRHRCDPTSACGNFERPERPGLVTVAERPPDVEDGNTHDQHAHPRPQPLKHPNPASPKSHVGSVVGESAKGEERVRRGRL